MRDEGKTGRVPEIGGKRRKVEDVVSIPAEVPANISLEATNDQIKTLFRLKDDVQAVGQFPTNPTFVHVALLAAEFYKKHDGLKNDWKSLLPPEDLPECEESKIHDIRPVRINMILNPATLREFRNHMKDVMIHMKRFEARVNVYWVLNEIFRYCLSKEKEFKDFSTVDKEDEDPDVGFLSKCEICNERSRINEVYCEAVCCGKCKRFFQNVMREKTAFSLKCSKKNNCFRKKKLSPDPEGKSRKVVADISCRKCRIDQCRRAGMLEGFYHREIRHPSSKTCSACSQETDLLRLVRGVILCSSCEGFFDQTVELNYREMNKKRVDKDPWTTDQVGPVSLINVYKCIGDSAKCTFGTATSQKCYSCLWNKMVSLGLDDTYVSKYGGLQRSTSSNYDGDSCCVCDQEAKDTPWMGRIVCQVSISKSYSLLRFRGIFCSSPFIIFYRRLVDLFWH